MATDASRRWLNTSGIWSCRIKLPNDSSRHLGENAPPHSLNSIIPTTMDVPMELTSPSSRRNKGKLAEAIQSMSNLNNSMESLDLPIDPDTQATVTDFLDFTEYLPSDMIRSLTLIGNLDQAYCEASANVNDLTKKYGDLPNLPLDQKLDPIVLRADISENLSEAIRARTSAHAEACRMSENVDRHYSRAKNILAKLQDMMEKYPPSREPSPVPTQKPKAVSRAPKITLRVGTEPPQIRVHKHRAPRITVPGEVLAPYELDYESYGSESEDFEDEAITPRATPARNPAPNTPKITLKIPKPKKDKTEKDKGEKGEKPGKGDRTPRPPRPPGAMGTNVHSQLAGISTSNALALLRPPPADAVCGSEHRPWLKLTQWELANLRKRMKKNAVWSPSDTMIARELKSHGRGVEAYHLAKATAEANGEVFNQPVPPQLNGQTVHEEGAISVEALSLQNVELSNRGMKLNEAKKLKKEHQAKELAKMAAEEAEESARKVAEAANVVKGLFSKPGKDDKKATAKTLSKAVNKKRKREPSISTKDDKEVETPVEGDSAKLARPPLKRTKTETPVPAPIPIAKQNTPATIVESAPSISSEAAPTRSTGTPAESVPVPVSSPKKSTSSILPPTKDKKGAKKEVKKTELVINTRTRRSSAIEPITPAIEPPSSKRPTSSRSAVAEGITATAAIDRPRRSSTARNTPAPIEPRPQNKRAKKPAPGPMAAGAEGSASVSVGKRSSATRKKAGAKNGKKDGIVEDWLQEVIYDEIDDEGKIIDPNEPRYCLCNRVSFGTMIGCENTECEKEWFHLECVGLDDVPARTTKWYCPDCRVKLRIGEKGEVNARGKKK